MPLKTTVFLTPRVKLNIGINRDVKIIIIIKYTTKTRITRIYPLS